MPDARLEIESPRAVSAPAQSVPPVALSSRVRANPETETNQRGKRPASRVFGLVFQTSATRESNPRQPD